MFRSCDIHLVEDGARSYLKVDSHHGKIFILGALKTHWHREEWECDQIDIESQLSN